MHSRRHFCATGAGGGGIGKVLFPVVSSPLGGGGRGLSLPPVLSAAAPSSAAAASSEDLDLPGPPFYDEVNPNVEDDHASGRDVKVEDRSHHLERHVVREFGLALFVCNEKKGDNRSQIRRVHSSGKIMLITTGFNNWI